MILALIGFFVVFGSGLFLVIRIFFKNQIKESEKATKSSFLIAFSVVLYFFLMFVFHFTGHTTVVKIMLVLVLIYGLACSFIIGKKHE